MSWAWPSSAPACFSFLWERIIFFLEKKLQPNLRQKWIKKQLPIGCRQFFGHNSKLWCQKITSLILFYYYYLLSKELLSYKMNFFKPIWSGGGGGNSPHLYFSTVAARRSKKVGVMGYVNLSYYVGKTPKQVSGLKNFLGPVQRPSKSGCQKFLVPWNLDFSTSTWI